MNFNLDSSQSDRAKFDEIQEQYAEAMISALDVGLALEQTPSEYAEIGWESFEIDLEVGAVQVDNLEEAKARFLTVFSATVSEWQDEKVDAIKAELSELLELRDAKKAELLQILIAKINS